MVSVDGSIVLQIVNFLVLIWILNMVLYKPIRKILLERKEKMVGMQSDIDGSAEQVQSKEDAYAEGVRQARAAGQKEKEALMQAAAEEEKAIIGKRRWAPSRLHSKKKLMHLRTRSDKKYWGGLLNESSIFQQEAQPYRSVDATTGFGRAANIGGCGCFCLN